LAEKKPRFEKGSSIFIAYKLITAKTFNVQVFFIRVA